LCFGWHKIQFARGRNGDVGVGKELGTGMTGSFCYKE